MAVIVAATVAVAVAVVEINFPQQVIFIFCTHNVRYSVSDFMLYDYIRL